MKTTLSFWVPVVYLLLAACSTTHVDGAGGETNWLTHCSSDDECGAGDCVCGVCSRACDSEAGCSEDFAGTCLTMASAQGAALCKIEVSAPPAGVCLPSCSSDQACGDGYACKGAACVPRTMTRDQARREAQLDQLVESMKAWNDLVADNGDTYWYEEENCVENAFAGTWTLVQVEAGVARIVDRRDIDRSECQAEQVNRYEAFMQHTVPELYDECALMVRYRNEPFTLRFDELGVLKGCVQDRPADCIDACGDGFLLHRLEFGADPGSPWSTP